MITREIDPDEFATERMALNSSITLLMQDNQQLVGRINKLNSEKSALEIDRNKWKKWYRFMALMAALQVFFYTFVRHWI